jgi:hypothetical protein
MASGLGGQARDIGPLPYCKDDSVRLNCVFRPRDFVELGSTAREAPKAYRGTTHASDGAIRTDRYLSEHPRREDLYSLLDRIVDFPGVGRHVLPRLEARHPYPDGAQTHGTGCAVKCHAAAAEDEHSLAYHSVARPGEIPVAGNLLPERVQRFCRDKHSRQLGPRNGQSKPALRPDCNENGVVVRQELNRIVNARFEPEVDSQHLNGIDLTVNYLTG